MKYILLMSGTKAGVDTYVAWSKKDIDGHMAVLKSINSGANRIRRVCGHGKAWPARTRP